MSMGAVRCRHCGNEWTVGVQTTDKWTPGVQTTVRCRRCGQEVEISEAVQFASPPTRVEKGDPRPRFCDYLRALGVKARPAGRNEQAAGGGDEWLIDVAEGPIRHVLIWQEYFFGWPDDRDPADSANRKISYLVPDSRIGPNFSRSMGLEAEGIIIGVNAGNGCWVLTEGIWTDDENIWRHVPDLDGAVIEHAPSRLQWDGYQAIAKQLLAAPLSPTGRPIVQAQFEKVQQRLAVELAALRELGIAARPLERDPLSESAEIDESGEPIGWIEIAEGPIRWIHCSSYETVCCVPDPRFRADVPKVALQAEPKTVRSFPLFGRRTVTGVHWKWRDLQRGDNKKLSLSVAKRFTQDTDIEETIMSGDYYFFTS